MIWDPLIIAGLIMITVGVLKRDTEWGWSVAATGAITIVASLLLAGPEFYDGLREAYQRGYEAGMRDTESTR
ncbi:MAG: hypothetical protein GVY25_05570 [Bacteroidetes bacterium]|jgi:hypothetical protein|nr:hypothetical protein [Bacteroidota bacterium]